MSGTKELLAELDNRVSKVLSELRVQKTLSDEKSLEIESLKNESQVKNDTIARLQKEHEALKLVKPAEDQQELKSKIGEMVREIDRCISLLKV